ncbi:MAG: hypothetical protein J0I06_05275 [Planctomycetes bacterium]|nr:hypothetical protein [Planctomycetota bacterium]
MSVAHRKILVAKELGDLTIRPEVLDGRPKPRRSVVWRLAQRLRAEVFKEPEFRHNLKTDADVFTFLSRTQSFPGDPGFDEALQEVAEGRDGPGRPGSPVQKAAELLCENRTEPDHPFRPEMRIDWFTGTVNFLDEEVGHVTLLDEECKEYTAQFDRARVAEAGLKPGDHFICLLTGDGEQTEMELIRREKQPLTKDQKQGIHRLVREAVQLLSETDHAAQEPESKKQRRQDEPNGQTADG